MVHSSAELATLGAEPAHPAIVPALKEGPPASRDATVVVESTEEDALTGEDRRGASLALGATSMSLASIGPTRERRIEAIPSQVSLMNHGCMAERLLATVCLSEFQAEFSRLDASTFLQDAFMVHLWAVNSLSTLRNIAFWSDHTHQESSATLARAEKAESALKVAQGEAEEPERALGVAQREAEEAKRALGAFQEEVEEVRRQGAANLGRACATEEELEKMAAELRALRQQLDTVIQEVKELEGWTKDAEEIARMVDARATDADAKVADAAA